MMSRFLNSIIMTVVMVVALVGCSKEFTINTAQFAAGLSTLDAQYETVSNIVANNSRDYTAAERQQLTRADHYFQQLRSAAHELIVNSGGIAQAVIKADEVRMLYNLARSSYRSVRHVICPELTGETLISPASCTRLASMEPYEQQMLLEFDQNARRTREALTYILNGPSGADVTQAVSDVLTIGATAARIARLGVI